MTTLMLASLVTAIAAIAVRVGMRRPAVHLAVVEQSARPLPVAQPQALQCPVCQGQHAAAKQQAAGP